jgi:hypothetical protein
MECIYCSQADGIHLEGCPKLHPKNLKLIKLFAQGYVNGRHEREVDALDPDNITFAMGWLVGFRHREKKSQNT